MKNNLKKEIIERLLIAFNLEKVNDLADMLNVSPQNLNGYIDRDSYIKLARRHLLKQGININWIKTGLGEMQESQTSKVSELNPIYSQKINIADLKVKTEIVLRSNTAYSTVLKDIIVAYYEATICLENLAAANKKIDKQEEQILEIKDRLPAAGE